ncbi:MAG TPA: hypothetical protein VN696_14455 [Pyrinomonadaceae bacterium]|nr:hypothetical protein [Pyrinomonadaceae bacterium]
MRRFAIITAAFLMLLPASAWGQTRTRRSSSSTKRTTSTAPAVDTAAIATRTEAANKVANQIKNLSAFLYLLGGVAKGMEQIDITSKNDTSSPVVKQNELNKIKLRGTFTDFRVGLDALEIYFRSTPGLQSYYLKLAGSASGAADAEALANQGQFDRAGRALLGVVNRLTDVLVDMH